MLYFVTAPVFSAQELHWVKKKNYHKCDGTIFVNPAQFMTCTALFMTFAISFHLFIKKICSLISLMMDISNLILNMQKLALPVRMKTGVFIQNRVRRVNKQFSSCALYV